MKKSKIILRVLLLVFLFVLAFYIISTVLISQRSSTLDKDVTFKGQYGPIPQKILKRMKSSSWRPGCPVPLDKLAYMKFSFWGYDGKFHEGELIVHRKVAPEVLQIFIDLFEARFPIESMRLIDEYDGSDERSMKDNNTSAFNCRFITGKHGVFSKHSYGVAIDINPLYNPYVSGSRVEPPEGIKYVDRNRKVPGMIVRGDTCYNAFIKRGWVWGGEWKNIKDYQHFEKNINNK